MSDYDRTLEPPEEAPRWWNVTVIISREYEGPFYGTRASAEQDAQLWFKRHDGEHVGETITAKSEVG